MRHFLAASFLATALLTVPALAQQPAPGAGKPARAVTATGTTKPPATPKAGGAPMSPGNEVAMLKAQKAAAARDKAWDSRMRTTLGSICRGC